MDDPQKPIVVSASPIGAQTNSGVAAVLLIVSALPALMAVLGTGDVMAIVRYIASADFAAPLGLLVAAGTVLWRQLAVRWSHQDKAKLADDASIGVVK